MNLNKKKILIIILIILIIIILTITGIKLFYNNPTTQIPESIKEKQNTYSTNIDWNNTKNIEFKNDNKYNTSKKIKKEHKYEEYNFTNMKLYTKDDKCIIEFDITNINNNSSTKKTIFINFKNKKGEIIHTQEHKMPSTNKGETKTEKIEIPIDVSNAYDYEINGL